MRECSLCRLEFAGEPYGPPDCEVCLPCWLRTGDRWDIRLQAHGPEPGDEVHAVDRDGVVVASGYVASVSLKCQAALVRGWVLHDGQASRWCPWGELRHGPADVPPGEKVLLVKIGEEGR